MFALVLVKQKVELRGENKGTETHFSTVLSL